jgi:hypothetical protein
MTTLASSLSTDVKGCFAAMQGRPYFVNDFDVMKVWNAPKATADDAGITAPAGTIGAESAAGGSTTNGSHEVRYRYRNSKTGYVSNPSGQRTVTVTGGNGQLTFSIGGGLDIEQSADAKVDTIVVEMTPVNSGDFYVAQTCANSASSVVVNIPDTSLIQQQLVKSTTGDFGHEKPPLFAILVAHRGRFFGFGTTTRTRSSVTFTNGSATVTGANFSTSWVGRLIRAAGSAVAYEITAVAGAGSLTIASTFAEATTTATASIFSKFPNRGYWTAALYPEAWKPLEQARDFLQNKADQITGALSNGSDIFLFGSRSAERFSYNVDPAVGDGQTMPIPGDRGVFNQRCLVQSEGEWYAFDRQGIYQVSPSAPSHVSGPVDATLTELVDFDYQDSFHGCWDPVDRLLCWFFVRAGDTSPKYAVIMEKDTGRWYFHRYLMGITGSAVVATSDGQVRMMLGDENGYTWFAGIEDSFDGVPPSSSTVLTTSGTPTTTAITVTNTLPTGSTTLAGVTVYDPVRGNTAVIASNTATDLTLAGGGLATAPSTGQELWIGVIPVELRTKWLAGQSLDTKKRPVYLSVKLYPGATTGRLRVYYYLDFAVNPFTWTKGSADTFPDGVTITNGATYAEVALSGGATTTDGQVSVPVPGNFWRALQVRITSDRPDGALRILDFGFVASDGSEVPALAE